MKLVHKWNFLSISKERKNKIHSYPRKDRCKLFALEYIIYKKIHSLPINFISDFYDVFEDFEWIILDYDEAKIALNKTDPLNIKKRNALARTFHERHSKVFLTVYVKNKKYPNQDYYTIAHELGHIILGHFIEFENTALERGGLTKNEYAILEREAEIFAAELLMPMPILKRFKINSSAHIITLCNVSKTAAEIRLQEFKQIRKINSLIKPLYLKTNDLFNNFINKKYCTNCNYGFILKKSKFCPICGTKKLLWGDGKMLYKGIDINEKGKAIKCPICGNEEISDGCYCHICGAHISNLCSNPNCDSTGPLLGTSRFCHFCGEESTFYQNQLLSNWEDSQIKFEVNSEDLFDNTDTSENELPF